MLALTLTVTVVSIWLGIDSYPPVLSGFSFSFFVAIALAICSMPSPVF